MPAVQPSSLGAGVRFPQRLDREKQPGDAGQADAAEQRPAGSNHIDVTGAGVLDDLPEQVDQ